MARSGVGKKRDLAELELDCHHKVKYAKPYPEKDSEIYCLRCCDIRLVLLSPDTKGNFGFRCDCGYSRHYGVAKLHSQMMATRHHVKYPWHTTYLVDGEKVYHIYKAYQDPDIFTDDGLPIEAPF